MQIADKIMRRVKRLAYTAFWSITSAGFAGAQKEIEKQAGLFLAEKGLIKNPGDAVRLALKWDEYVKEMFDPAKPEEFYLKWKADAGAANIAANIRDQFSRKYLLWAMKKYLGKGYRGRMLDFGCGTAAAAAAYVMKFSPGAVLELADVENLASEFVSYFVFKYPLLNISKTEISLAGIPDNYYDAAMCIHVLEHLKNPSGVFIGLAGKIKPGGILFLEAPWGGHPEHLPEAPLEWESGGGALFLKEKFIKKGSLDPFCGLSGVYEKTGS